MKPTEWKASAAASHQRPSDREGARRPERIVRDRLASLERGEAGVAASSVLSAVHRVIYGTKKG